MATSPDEVAAPAADAILFRASRVRMFAQFFLIVVVVRLVLDPVLTWILGDTTADPWWGRLLEAALLGAAFAAFLTFVGPGRQPTWVRTSSGGLELSAAGSDPIQLDWADIAHVEVHRQLLRWTLEVTPTSLDRVRQVEEGNGMPRLRGETFTADISRLTPSPRRLQHELAVHAG